MGVLIALGARSAAGGDKQLAPEWRGWICIVGSTAAFIAPGKYGGHLRAWRMITEAADPAGATP